MSRQANQSVYKIIQSSPQDIIASSTAAHNSTPFSSNTSIIRIATTTDIRYSKGPSAVAVSTDTLLPAGAVEYVTINPGYRLSVIQHAVGGVVNVSECTK